MPIAAHRPASPARSSPGAIPVAVHRLALTTFVVTTSEFMVAGLMPTLADAFAVSVAEIGYLISSFALGMALGGPLATVALVALRVPHKPALLLMLGLFLLGSVLAAAAPGYGVMALARVTQGVSSAACLGLALTICAGLVPPDLRGRAASLVMAGLMLSPILGVPAAALVSQHFGWQAAFWSVAALAALCLPIVAAGVPSLREGPTTSLAGSVAGLASGALWAAYATSALIIGATFAAFSYFSAIFTQLGGFSEAALPLLLAGYGLANILGNLIIGRLADRFTIPVLAGGLVVLSGAMALFALGAADRVLSVTAFLLIGLTGVSLNPAMVARVMRAAHPGPLVNAMHTSMITAGLALGSWAGGYGIDAGYGLRAPLWTGFILALLGLASLLPRRFHPAAPA